MSRKKFFQKGKKTNAMKKSFLLIVIVVCFVDCSNQSNTEPENKDTAVAASTPTESKAEKNKQTALNSIQGVSDHDINKASQDMDPNFVDYADGSAPPIKGLDSAKTFLLSFLNAFPDMKSQNVKAFSNEDGSEIVVTAEWTGTLKNDFMGIKATNKSFKVNEADIFTFNDNGKITSHSNIQPFATILNQVGAKMPK